MKTYTPAYFFLLFMLLIPGFSGYGQHKENTEYNIWNVKPGDTSRIYGRTANIRVEPAVTAAIQDSLPCGTKVIILSEDTIPENVKGIYAPWLKVKYSVGNASREGYLWLGMCALKSFEKGSTTFLYGIEKLTAARNNLNEDFVPAIWFIRVKAIDNRGNILDEKEVKMDGVETSVSDGKLLGNMGLDNTEDVVRINFGGEACGIPTNYYYFGWTGSKFLSLPGKMEVGDAGVFYHTETFLFPKEQGGQPGKIIKLTEEGESDGEKVDKHGEPVFKIKKSRVVYVWNGKQAVKIK